jgi:hypothetical protein
MHKDGNCKEVMKKIKQQWGNFSEEDIAKMQESYEERERRYIKRYRDYPDDIRSNN